MKVDGVHTRTVWLEGSTVRMVDQQALPHKFVIVDLRNYRCGLFLGSALRVELSVTARSQRPDSRACERCRAALG